VKDTSGYPPLLAELLALERLQPLGPRIPNEKVRARLQQLTVETAFAGHTVRDADMAQACLAGLWLYHDFLDESHRISQDIDTPTGSYWHGILHRREPDPSNAAYWFRRVGKHPIFPALSTAARDLGLPLPSDRWDPFAFIDLCEKHRDTGDADEQMLRRVQQQEWELLFDWCFRQAIISLRDG
jgi:hypothetical protein